MDDDGIVDVAIQFGELRFQGLQDCLGHPLNSRIAWLMRPIGLHADHLAAAGDQFGQALAVGIGERAWFGTNAFGKQGNDLGIQRVGLGEAAGSAGKVPDLAWVDDGEWQSGAGESGSDADLKAAGGFQHNQGWSQNA